MGINTTVELPAGPVTLAGDLTVPADPAGVVVFAHGSGSGRGSPRNRMVAGELVDAGVATLLIDLLTGEEDAEDRETRRLRFDVSLLSRRVVGPTPGTTVPACQRSRVRRLAAGTRAMTLRRSRGAGPTPGAEYHTRRTGAAGARVWSFIGPPSVASILAFPAASPGNPQVATGPRAESLTRTTRLVSGLARARRRTS